tara:strand:- start:147 stop:1055 length:909 start_codon:yes stop_codon:yes gene_type:complete
VLVSEYEMPKTNFTVKYDGDALANHEMDVAILAPALMGMQKVLDALVTESTEGEYRASLKIKGNAKAGSIEIELVTQAISNMKLLKDIIVDVFSHRDVVALATITTLLVPLLALIKKFGRRKPSKVEDMGDGNVKIYFDNDITIVNNHVYHVYNNFEVREAAYKAVKPLEQEGIDSFVIYEKSKKLVEVNKEDVSRFVPPSVADRMLVSEEITFLQIVTIKFNMNNKWQFTQGDSVINANIIDDDFIAKVRNGVPFQDGDILKVKLQKEQYQEKGKLKTNYKILEVLDHQKAAQQQPFDFDS